MSRFSELKVAGTELCPVFQLPDQDGSRARLRQRTVGNALGKLEMQNPRAPRDDQEPGSRNHALDDHNDESTPLWRRLVFPVAGTVVAGIWVLALGSILPKVIAGGPPSQAGTATASTAQGGTGDASLSAPPIPGRWTVQQSVDPLTDERRVVAILPAEGPASGVRLIAGCTDTTSFTIDWGVYLGSDSEHVRTKYVTTRLGTEPAKTTGWEITNNERGTYEWGGKWLLQSMLDQDRYVAQVTPYQSGPLTAVFDLTGLREAITPLAEACDWLLDATDMPVLVEYDRSGATLFRHDMEFRVDPVTEESTKVDLSSRYRIRSTTKGADLIEACRGRAPDNACYVRIRHEGGEVTELLSARSN